MDKDQIKQILLNYDLVIDNLFLDQYVELIYNNLNTEAAWFKTQTHHVIPIEYYNKKYNIGKEKRQEKSKAYATLDQNNFIVNLLIEDHIKAHLYLSLCAKEGWFLNNSFSSAKFILINPYVKNRLNTDQIRTWSIYKEAESKCMK